MKIGKKLSILLVFMLLVSSFVLMPDKKAFASTSPVTWNPNDRGSNVTLSNGNLTATSSQGCTNGNARATVGVSSGKWYWEIKINNDVGQSMIGVANASAPLSIQQWANVTDARTYYGINGTKFPGGLTYGTSFTTNDVIGVALDMDAGTIIFYKNGVSQGVAFTDVKTCGTTIYPYFTSGSAGGTEQVTANFGATSFTYPVPTGYNAYNLSSLISSPTNLLTTVGNGQVNLTWNAVTDATSYNVKRSTTSGGIYTTIATNVTSPNYTDTSVTNGTTYYYVVTAVNANGESAYSNEVSATPQAPLPSSPTNLLATAGTGQVSLTWDAVTNATSYDVKRSTTSGGIYTTISTGLTSPNYNDTTVTNGTEYYYVVTALNASGESGNSNEATATPQSPVPSSPTNLLATTGTGQVSLTWTAVTGATGYNVKRATTAGGSYTSIAQNVSTTNYTDASVAAGSTYYYVVTALTSGGESANSNEASATLSAPAGDRLYVLLDINEQAQLSVTNNLTDNTTLTWTSSDPTVATVDANGKVTALKEGTCFINVANSDNTYTDYIPIKVMKGATNYRLALHLKAGESKRLWITDNSSSVTWTSMDTSVASIDSTGKVTAVANGLCIVQGELNGKTYLIYVRVNS